MTTATTRTGPLAPHHRARVQEILEATGVFRPEEIDVALELFDEGVVPVSRDTGSGDEESRPHAAGSTQDAASSHAPLSTQHSALVPSPSSYVLLGAFTPADELVGYACYGATPGTDRTFDLYWIAVHPSAQGTGSGTILLSEVERRLEDTDARLFVVETSSRSEYEPTRAFYRARGYAEAARMRDFYAPSDDRIIFTKRFHHPHGGKGAVSR